MLGTVARCHLVAIGADSIAGIDIGEGGSKGVAAVLLRRPCHCVLAKHAANGIMPALFPSNGVAEAHGADDV